MTAEELEEYRKLLCVIDDGGCCGADIADFQEFAMSLVEHYGSAKAAAVFGDDVRYWEFPLFNHLGQFGPKPKVGWWTAKGWLIGTREMTKKEQVSELFPTTRSEWKQFRDWLAVTNPLEFRCLNRFFEA